MVSNLYPSLIPTNHLAVLEGPARVNHRSGRGPPFLFEGLASQGKGATKCQNCPPALWVVIWTETADAGSDTGWISMVLLLSIELTPLTIRMILVTVFCIMIKEHSLNELNNQFRTPSSKSRPKKHTYSICKDFEPGIMGLPNCLAMSFEPPSIVVISVVHLLIIEGSNC